MKIRNGFVSNSSSSSFIVIRNDCLGNKAIALITPEEEKLLVDNGFKKVNCYYADQVPNELYLQPKPPSKAKLKMLKKMKIKTVKNKVSPNLNYYFNYGYDCICNEDEIIYFLLKNNIPFEASVHYSHQNVFYKRDAKFFMIIQNYGIQAAMSNWNKDYSKMLEMFSRKDIVEKVNVKKYLKQQKAFQDNYLKIEAESIKEHVKNE